MKTLNKKVTSVIAVLSILAFIFIVPIVTPAQSANAAPRGTWVEAAEATPAHCDGDSTATTQEECVAPRGTWVAEISAVCTIGGNDYSAIAVEHCNSSGISISNDSGQCTIHGIGGNASMQAIVIDSDNDETRCLNYNTEITLTAATPARCDGDSTATTQGECVAPRGTWVEAAAATPAHCDGDSTATTQEECEAEAEPGTEPGDGQGGAAGTIAGPSEELVTKESVSDTSVANNGDLTIFVGKNHAGKNAKVWIYSEPQLVQTVVVDAEGNVLVSHTAIEALHLQGTHTISVTLEDGTIIGRTVVVLNADGTVNVEATIAAIKALKETAEGSFPFIPAGVALLLVVSAGVVVTRKVTQK